MSSKSLPRLFVYIVISVYAVAYLSRYFYLLMFVRSELSLQDENPEWLILEERVFLPALLWSTAIFAVFVLFSLGTLPAQKRPSIVMMPKFALSVFIVATTIVSLILRLNYGAKLGEGAINLPFLLGPLLNRSQSDLIPGVLILMIEISWINSDRRSYYLWLLFFLGFQVALSAITTSKAGIIFFAIQILLLLHFMGKALFKNKLNILWMSIFGILFFVIGSELRSQAIFGTESEYYKMLMDGYVIEVITRVLGIILNRLPGLEGVALICGFDCSHLSDFAVPSFNGDATMIFTRDVMGVSRDFDYRSPGLIGGAILIAGWWGGGILTLAFLNVTRLILFYLDQVMITFAARVQLLFGLFKFILEGSWNIYEIIPLFIGVYLVELLALRLSRVRPLGSGPIKSLSAQREV